MILFPCLECLLKRRHGTLLRHLLSRPGGSELQEHHDRLRQYTGRASEICLLLPRHRRPFLFFHRLDVRTDRVAQARLDIRRKGLRHE